jgi:hypothetical protein
MQMKWRKLAAVLFASMIAGAFVGPAVASPPLHPGAGCNAGNGNGSETTPDNDCDPGNSAGNNNGGD